jgi:hypothetical protein
LSNLAEDLEINVTQPYDYYASPLSVSIGALKANNDEFPTLTSSKRGEDIEALPNALNLLHITCQTEFYVLRGTNAEMRLTFPRIHQLGARGMMHIADLAKCRDSDYDDTSIAIRNFPHQLGMWLSLLESHSGNYTFPREYPDWYSNITAAFRDQQNLLNRIDLPQGCRLSDWISGGKCQLMYEKIGDLIDKDVSLRLTISNCTANAPPAIYLDCYGADCNALVNPSNLVKYCTQDSDCLSGYQCKAYDASDNLFRDPGFVYGYGMEVSHQCTSPAQSFVDFINIISIAKGEEGVAKLSDAKKGVCTVALVDAIEAVAGNDLPASSFLDTSGNSIKLVGLKAYAGESPSTNVDDTTNPPNSTTVPAEASNSISATFAVIISVAVLLLTRQD